MKKRKCENCQRDIDSHFFEGNGDVCDKCGKRIGDCCANFYEVTLPNGQSCTTLCGPCDAAAGYPYLDK